MALFGKRILLALSILFFLFSVSCNVVAFSEEDVKVQYENVFLKGEKIIPVSVYNYSVSDRELKVEFIGPSKLGYEFVGLDEKIKASMRETFQLKLTPLSSRLEGKKYKTTLVVRLGNETVRKEIQVQCLKKAVQETAEGGETEGAEGAETTGLVVLSLANIELAVNVILAVIAIILAVLLIIRLKEKH